MAPECLGYIPSLPDGRRIVHVKASRLRSFGKVGDMINVTDDPVQLRILSSGLLHSIFCEVSTTLEPVKFPWSVSALANNTLKMDILHRPSALHR